MDQVLAGTAAAVPASASNDVNAVQALTSARLSASGFTGLTTIRLATRQSLLDLFPEAKTSALHRQALQAALSAHGQSTSVPFLLRRWDLILSDLCLEKGLNSLPILSRLRSNGISSSSALLGLSALELLSIFPLHATREQPHWKAASDTISFLRSLSLHSVQSPLVPQVEHSVPTGLWRTECLALGLHLSAWHLAFALFEVFDEKSSLRERSLVSGWQTLSSWRSRCEASGINWAADASQLDISEDSRPCLLPGPTSVIRSASSSASVMPPAKRMALGSQLWRTPRNAADIAALPLHDRRLLLMRESSIRVRMASVKGSWRSIASAIRCWAAFCDEFREGSPHFPAEMEDVLNFSAIFLNGGTFGNYLSALKFAHSIQDLTPQWNEEVIRRLRSGRRKLTATTRKPAVRLTQLNKMVDLADADHGLSLESSTSWLLCYSRLFRFQSELFPLETRTAPPADPLTSPWHSAAAWHKAADGLSVTSVDIHLRRRKNNPLPCILSTSCSCGNLPSNRGLCGVCRLHILWLGARQAGRQKVFSSTLSSLTSCLKKFAELAGTAPPPRFGFHVFRRGRTQDLVNDKAPLSQILSLGGWRSAACLHYMALDEVENRYLAVKHSEDSDSENDLS